MRPAQIAREIPARAPQAHVRHLASMRPAQIAREIEVVREVLAAEAPASMRPAQIAREIAWGARAGRSGWSSLQ